MSYLAKEAFQDQNETTELLMHRLLMQGRYARSHAFHLFWRGLWKDLKLQRKGD
ncbi:hypothetical protein PsAD13_02715 [Pseudovibrio sp. Ad13]|nr:hypothetical protein PsAD13_02715 [Pseudovibrio sp. Ad13]